MREIKFRLWDEKFQEMTNDVTLYANGWIACFFDNKGDVKYHPDSNIVKVMQYTGLKDKNGKEIYEGDIVNLTHMVYAGYGNVDEVTEAVVIEDITKLPFGPSTITCEVIGNIYENPELLEGEK